MISYLNQITVGSSLSDMWNAISNFNPDIKEKNLRQDILIELQHMRGSVRNEIHLVHVGEDKYEALDEVQLTIDSSQTYGAKTHMKVCHGYQGSKKFYTFEFQSLSTQEKINWVLSN